MKYLNNILSPDYLLIANKPISQPDSEIRRLSTHDVHAKFGFDYKENMTIDDPDSLADIKTTNEYYYQALQHALKSPLNDTLVVCHINDEVGDGVFTTEPIEAGRIIGLCAAPVDDEIVSSHNHQVDLSADVPRYPGRSNLLGDCDRIHNADEMPIGSSRTIIEIKNRDGITRFIQPMPECIGDIFDRIDEASKEEFINIAFSYGIYDEASIASIHASTSMLSMEKMALKNMILANASPGTQDIKTKYFLQNRNTAIATANTRLMVFRNQGIDISCIVTTRRIETNEQLGVCFGNRQAIIPRYFNKNTGDLIPLPLNDYLPGLQPVLAKYKTATNELPDINTALRRAVFSNEVLDVLILIEHGACVNTASPAGKTALDLVGANKGIPKTAVNLGRAEEIKVALTIRGATLGVPCQTSSQLLAAQGFLHTSKSSSMPEEALSYRIKTMS